MVIQQMSISDQVIAIINDLCQKFGIAIDWTAENVMPYLEDLCKRYIRFEVYTSIAWIVCFAAIMLLAGIIWGVSAIVHANSIGSYSEGVKYVASFVFWVFMIVTIIVAACQVFDIIECYNLPEKVIIEYVESLIRTSSNR